MTNHPPSRVGRPRGSSRMMLEEAAAELFLEQTYAGTTIEQIARRAGVSRNTFFNYFAAKSDLLWVEVDAGLAGLPAALAECAGAAGPAEAVSAVERALLQISAGFGPGHVPWALTQSELMGTTGELEASALSRFMALVTLVERFVLARTPAGAEAALVGRSFAMAVLAAAAAAAGVWARAGVSRGPLGPYLQAAIAPVCSGYRAVHAAG
ncbi:TetR family transcriptional regulator [Cryobacterium sp. TMT2-10]|uniref:TetR family transcriptional regulator n=1 Tax=Cryobacterium shii TaxID=1259235 RepID=A0AAQ2C541_9MICO|nr:MULTISPECIES: helix-turn-helix domain-containing protein [Cryobacterium]TFC43623.1 TetR family transcriptional regulator [Cryobacterium shii]TFC85995.1 TetR family transcriptional regulator [Cryobacterium sp. TmT2-59]TFD13736.1 TetR family transcriptional regulator [Cryobacterium sp. TMT4-10]TFD19747.1 TetR family transcriptional regulator [Cryobacterium sp. TMT2-23]TFD39844.1 TetR family transcriptional regulator [Cryobacterium sp. TMT2-10]